MLSFIFVLGCCLFELKRICACFLSFVYTCLCIAVWRSSDQERLVGIPLTDLTLPNFCFFPKTGPGFPMSLLICYPFCVQWVKVRGYCLFCWYWWNCLPSLHNNFHFKTNRHSHLNMYCVIIRQCLKIFWSERYILKLSICPSCQIIFFMIQRK